VSIVNTMAIAPGDCGPAHKFKKIDDVLERHGHDELKLIPMLQAVQEEYRYLPEPVLSYIATSLGIPRARVFGVATFYAHFSLQPKGKHIVRVCDGTACHVCHSQDLIESMQRKLALTDAKPTTDDMLFTLEKVSCIGACVLAPAVVVDDKVYGPLTVEQLDTLLDELIDQEERTEDGTA
jgi:NADH-quinone oxidoreductase subunit E